MLDRNLFKKQIKLLSVLVKDDQKLHDVITTLKKEKLIYQGRYLKTKVVVTKDGLMYGVTEIPQVVQKELSDILGETVQLEEDCLNLTYENYNAEDAFKCILPEEVVLVSSFEQVGHIAHFNLPEYLYPYKNVIGQIIVDKSPGIKTVVNKTNAIDNLYRNFKMELICGDENFVTKVKEQNCTFEFDFSKVYWNSRLQAEHTRLVEIIGERENVCDLFCGVGPFAIPLAKKNCLVYANDLNPQSIYYLEKNKKLNKIKNNLFIFNNDAKEFISNSLADLKSNHGIATFDHYILNLPASAASFLVYFRGLYLNENDITLPMIHCYHFASKDITDEDLRDEIETFMQEKMDKPPHIHNVRSVSPGKNMFCVSFRLPRNLALSNKKQK